MTDPKKVSHLLKKRKEDLLPLSQQSLLDAVHIPLMVERVSSGDHASQSEGTTYFRKLLSG